MIFAMQNAIITKKVKKTGAFKIAPVEVFYGLFMKK